MRVGNTSSCKSAATRYCKALLYTTHVNSATANAQTFDNKLTTRALALRRVQTHADTDIGRQFANELAVITYKTRSAGTPAYLSHLIRDYLPAHTLRSSDKLLLSVLV